MRYRGPKARLMRHFGEVLTRAPKYAKILERRKYPPGQHGQTGKRRAPSEYGRRMMEKQKLKTIYSISEAQLRRYMELATRRKGVTGENLLRILEQRLDQVVYRLGFAATIWGARQLVNHGHVRVNGSKVNIASYPVKPGSVISISESMKTNPHVIEALAGAQGSGLPPYLSVDRDRFSGTLVSIPRRDEIPIRIEDSLIVEFYAR
jgi:small subunit ribosomal protein S4